MKNITKINVLHFSILPFQQVLGEKTLLLAYMLMNTANDGGACEDFLASIPFLERKVVFSFSGHMASHSTGGIDNLNVYSTFPDKRSTISLQGLYFVYCVFGGIILSDIINIFNCF